MANSARLDTLKGVDNMDKLESILESRNISDFNLEPNDCILDVGTLCASFEIFYSGTIDAYRLFELFKFLETLVLFDHVYCYPNLLYPIYEGAGSPEDSNPFYFPKSEEIDYNILKRLIQEDIVRPLHLAGLDLQGTIDKYPVVFRPRTVDLLFGVAAEVQHNCQYITSMINEPQYAQYLRLRDSFGIYSELAAAYNSMCNNLLGDLGILMKRRRIRGILIPPIPALVFSKVNEPNEILDEILELREEFSRLRSHITYYKSKINDDSISLKESLTAYKELEKSTSELSKSFDSHGINLITEWKDGVSLIPKGVVSDQEGFDYKSIAKFFAGKPVEWLASRIRNRRLGQLFSTKRKFLKIENYGRLVKKIWGVDLNPADIDKLRTFLCENDELYEEESM